MSCWAEDLQVAVCISLSESRASENERQAHCIIPWRFVIGCHRLSKDLG